MRLARPDAQAASNQPPWVERRPVSCTLETPPRASIDRTRLLGAPIRLGERAWACEARATNGNLTVSLRRADRCGGMRVDDWCLRTGRHQLGAAGQREGDGPSHNGGHKADALSWDHGGQGERKNSWLSRMRISA